MTETKDTAARFVTAFNAHDEKTLNELHASDVSSSARQAASRPPTRTRQRPTATRWLKGFPNGKMTVRNEIVSAPWIVQEVTMEGTNTGPLEGPIGTIQPTHKHVVGKGVQVLKIENGKITEARIYFDMVDQLTQLGLMPVPATV